MTPPTIFSPAQLDALIHETIPADVPPSATRVVVGTVDQHGAQVVAGFTLRDAWHFEGAFRHEWTGENLVGGRVLWSG